MAHPGRMAGDDYIDAPYLDEWMPVEDRQWAMKFVNKDGSEDYIGFSGEYKKKYPLMFQNQVPAYLPATVDHYLRVDANGCRQDIDYDLAAIPPTAKEVEERELRRTAAAEKRRMDALAKRRKPATESRAQA